MLNISIIGADSTHTDMYAHYLNCTTLFENVRCTSLWSSDYNQTKKKAKKFYIDRVFENMDDAILCADFVIIALRYGEDHYLPAKRSLELGKPTFVDKPFVNSLKEAKDLSHLSELLTVPLISFSPVSMHDDLIGLRNFIFQTNNGAAVTITSPANSSLVKENKSRNVFYYGIHAVDLLLSITDTDCQLNSIKDDEVGIYVDFSFPNMVMGEINLIYDMVEEYRVNVNVNNSKSKYICINDVRKCFFNTLNFLIDNMNGIQGNTVPLTRSVKTIEILSKINSKTKFRR
jgi:predicted dehydrogenase